MKTTWTIVPLLGAFAVGAGGCAEVAFPDITNGQGEIAGEVTTTSVILQSRLTVGSELVEGDLAGAQGTARFDVATTPDYTDSFGSDWLAATADNDFIVKTKIDGLNPGTRYFYRLIFGPTQELLRAGPTRTFETLDGADVASESTFVVVTGMRYNAFQGAYEGPDKHLGYPRPGDDPRSETGLLRRDGGQCVLRRALSGRGEDARRAS